MSAETTTKPQLKDLGWRLRRADASDVPEGREPSGWVYYHESGARTPPQATAEQALAAARAVQDAWDELSAGQEAAPDAGPAAPDWPAGEGGRDGEGFAAGAEDTGGEDDADEGPAEVLAGRNFVVGDGGPKAWRGKAGLCVMRDGKRVTLEFDGGETHTFNYDVLHDAAEETPAGEAAPACELPEDLAAAGWALVRNEDDGPGTEHSGFSCSNAALRLNTTYYPDPADAVAAARKLQAREEKHRPATPQAPGTMERPEAPAAAAEHGAPDEAGAAPEGDPDVALTNRLLDWLSDNGVIGERDGAAGDAFFDVVTPKALALCWARVFPSDVMQAADDSRGARAGKYAAASVVLVCREAVHPERVERLAHANDIRLAVWPEGEEFPLPLSLFAPTLAEVVVGRTKDMQTLPEFQALVKNYRLDAVMAGDADPERFTLAEVVAIKEALDECAVRLGMQAAEGPAGDDGPLADLLPEPAAVESSAVAGRVELVGAADPDPEPAGAPLFAEGPAALRLSPQIRPDDISTHPSLLMRAGGLDPDHVKDLREVLRSGAEFKDDVVVFFDGERHWLADGNHRHKAAEEEGKLLGADVRRGSLRDAILWAVRSNAEHGKGRSNDDKRLAVVTLLADAEWHRLSDTALAGMARVSQPFVGSVRKELAKILPLVTEEASVESIMEGSGAPLGLVEIVLHLPGDELERLAQNVMGDDGRRVGQDGVVRRQPAAVEEPPELFDYADEAETGPAAQPVSEIEEAREGGTAADAGPPDAHGGEQPEARREPESPANGDTLNSAVVVNDRRRFADAVEIAADVRTEQEETPGPAAEAAPAPAPREERKPAGPTVEEVIGGRACSVSYTWIPGVAGKVSVVVNVGGKPPQEATRQLVAASALGRLPEPVMELLKADAAKKSAAAKGGAAKPAAAKKGAAKKAASKAPARAGAKKAPATRAAKKAAAKKPPAKSAPARGRSAKR